MTENSDSTILRYSWEMRQRVPFLILGILLAAAQALEGQYAFAAVFLVAFTLIFFTYGQTQTRLDGEGISWRGSFGRQQAGWNQVKSIEPGKALGIRQLRIAIDGKPTRTLPAPITGLFFRDNGFDSKSEQIRSFAATHGAPLGTDPDAREGEDA